MLPRIKHAVVAAAIIAVGCSQHKAKVTVPDVQRLFKQYESSLADLSVMLLEDESVVDVDINGTIREPVSMNRQKQYLALLKEIRLPIHHIFCDRDDEQLTANVLVEGWGDIRLVYTNGSKPKEPILTCNECPNHLFEPLADGWYVGIIEWPARGDSEDSER